MPLSSSKDNPAYFACVLLGRTWAHVSIGSWVEQASLLDETVYDNLTVSPVSTAMT
ncbi:hypothetical protein AbraCBS73388_009300, partial [Aspergillus brasiliensis]